MIGKDDALRLLGKVIGISCSEQAEAALTVENLQVTRWNDNFVHQNLSRRDTVLHVRIVEGKRTGSASTSKLDETAIHTAVEAAKRNAMLVPPNPDFKSLPAPTPFAAVNSVVGATAQYSAAERADGAGVAIATAEKKGLTSSGAFSTQMNEFAVVNSLGVQAYNAGTVALYRTIINNGDLTGYADRLSRDARDLSFAEIVDEALLKATLKQSSVAIEPGEYDTVFEAYAVADLIRFLGYLAFGSLAKQEGRSFMSRQMGQKVMGDNVSIWDDGLDPRGLSTPFDAEGVPKKRVALIERGVATGVVYDSLTASREGLESTGHATPHWARWRVGPMPSNMFLGTGDATTESMIASTQKGILVTRFHYTHAPDPVNVVATGTTRDGTFLIENGEITRRLKNLRFTESMIRAFGHVEAISGKCRLTRDWWSTFISVLPSIKINGYRFTGATTF